MINECTIFDIVDITGLVYNLQTETEHEKDKKNSVYSKRNDQRKNRKYRNSTF